jgi:uncharacterized membrane protein
MSCHSQCVCHSGYSDECVSRVWFWYQFHDALVCKCSLCSTSTKLTIKQTQHLLNPWTRFKCLHRLTYHLLLLWQGTDWTDELKTDKSMKLLFTKTHRNLYSRMQNSLNLVQYCTKQCNECLYAFISSPTDCIWTHLPHHPAPSALSWNMNININLRKFDGIYSQLQIL